MNRQEIIDELTAERDCLQRAIDALTEDVGVLPRQPKPKLVATARPGTRKQSLACMHGCGKEFTSEAWKKRHELDCAHVIKPNGSAAVTRHA